MTKCPKLHLDTMTSSIAQSLHAGIISFDNKLNVIDHTPDVENILDLRPAIHQTLAVGTDPNIWDDWRTVLSSVLKNGEHTDFGVVRYNHADTSRLLHISCVPIIDTNNNGVLGGTIILMDATEKLDAEHEMAQAERLMAIGKIAGKVAHELNNPLDGILRYVNLTLRIIDQNQPEKAREYLTHCRNGLKRMAQIITEMLEFSRTANQAMETSPIDKLLDDALRAMDSSLRGIEVQIIRRETGPLPHVKSDSLFQVFCNLIKNAYDAMAGDGKLTITFDQSDDAFTIEFCDTGHGFDPQKADELFRPFYTTKPKGRGTGLGLSICKDILEKLNGKITPRNKPEGGACFTISLPCPQPVVTPKKP